MKTSIKEFAEKRKYLFWSTKRYDRLSDEIAVENTLNYGDFDDVKEIISILGVQKTADIFEKQIHQKRCNYRPEIANYFKLYFNKYASRDIR